MKFETGDILCYKSTVKWNNFLKSKENFAEFMIKIGTFSKYVHVGIVVEADYTKEKYNNQVVVGQALQNFDIRGQHFYLNTLLKEEKLLVKRFPKLSEEQKKLITQTSYMIEGDGYDWLGILKMVIFILTGKTFFKDDAKRFFCSEAIDYILRAAFIKLFRKASRNVMPSDFAETNKLLKAN